MGKPRAGLLIALLLFTAGGWAAEEAGTPLALSGYNYFTPVPVYLSPDDGNWLKQKKTLRVAVYPPEHPLLAQSTVTGRYRGINADYLALIQNSLNTRFAVLRFADRASAVTALQAGECDMVLTGLDDIADPDGGLRLSRPLVHSWTALVTTLANVMSPLHGAQSVTIGRVNNYPDDAFIHQAFPNGEIINYPSYQEAMSGVASGENNYFIGDSLTTGAWLSREFSQVLTTVKYWPQPQKQNRFLFAAADHRLPAIIDRAIDSIDEHTHGQIARTMVDKGNLSFLINGLDLTEKEKQWLKSHPRLRVIINPWFAPYTLVDGNQEARGIVGDILNLVALQTGMEFDTRVVKSNDEMIAAMKQGDWDIV